MHWRSHAALAKSVVDGVVPPFQTLAGAPMAQPSPWLIRVDVGVHAAGDLDNGCDANAPDKAKKRRVCFVNEIEIVPTLYLDDKFKHDKDFLAIYARGFLKTAFEAAGRPFPDANQPQPHRPVASLSTRHNQAAP